MNTELTPIIGGAGVRALLRRSVFLVQTEFDWLQAHADAEATPDPIGRLCEGLARRSRAEAVATNRALVLTFYRLLAGLIGESLADRLLEPVLSIPSAGPSAQDPSQ